MLMPISRLRSNNLDVCPHPSQARYGYGEEERRQREEMERDKIARWEERVAGPNEHEEERKEKEEREDERLESAAEQV